MVRHAIGLAGYPGSLASATGRAWHGFFFTPADPTPVGLIRVVVGLLLIWSFGNLGADLPGNLGADGWTDPEALRAFWKEWKHGATLWSLWLFIPDRYLTITWVAGMVVLTAFTVGLWSRTTALLSWLLIASTVRRAPVLFFGFDQTILTWTMYLAVCGASGQALSLDRLIRSRRSPTGSAPAPTVSANLGLRLIQLHLCLIYGMAGLAKLQGSSWWNGEAALAILVLPEYRVRDLTWLAAYPWVINLMTHATVAIEVLYPVLIWGRLTRPLMILAAVLLHVGIDQTMGLTEFSLAMIAGNLAFVSGPWLRGSSGRLHTVSHTHTDV